MTGNPDSEISLSSSNIVHPLHDNLLFDDAFVPVRPLDPVDHRGRKVCSS